MVTTSHAGGRSSARILELALLVVLPPLLHYVAPIAMVVHKPIGYLGGAPMVVGIALGTAARDAFRDAGTRLALHGGPSSLVTSGPYRVSRNPMYLGMVLWLLGMAVFFGSLVTFIFPIASFAFANFVLVPREEAELARSFGQAYEDYRRAVRRWL